MEISAGNPRWQSSADAPDGHAAIPLAIVRFECCSNAAPRSKRMASFLRRGNRQHMRDSRLDGRQHRKARVRLVLIPIRYGIEVVSAIVGVPVFNRRAQGFGEGNRGVEMKAVDGPTPAL